MSLLSRSLIVSAAFALDRLIGDPVRPTHPARLLGHSVALYEKGARWALHRSGQDARPAGDTARAQTERAAGIVLAAGLPLFTYGLTRRLLAAFPRPLRPLAEVWLLSTALAGRDLGDHARRVDQGLNHSLAEGRRRVGLIVGRETAAMGEPEVVRATVETVAENTSDGLVGPLLYGLAGGAPLALGYKAVSTLDSMVGYRNQRYVHFGWASARLDDLINLLPARLTALLATVAGRRGASAAGRWWADRRHHASPNAGLVEAAFAQALRVRLGGGAWYGGRYMEREPVGREFREPERQDIERAVRLSEGVGRLALAGGVAVLLVGSLLGVRTGRTS